MVREDDHAEFGPDTPVSAEDRVWLTRLWDALAGVAPDAFAALAQANPETVGDFGGGDVTLRRLRAALQQADGPSSNERFARLANALAGADAGGGAVLRPQVFADAGELQGLLTSVTRSLAPERALELYRTIAPHVVVETLRTLGQSPRLDTVLAVAEHLCSDEVQARLRQHEHIRDGLLDELSLSLQDGGLKERLNRGDLQAILERCGAMRHVIAMANCIKLARTKAG